MLFRSDISMLIKTMLYFIFEQFKKSNSKSLFKIAKNLRSVERRVGKEWLRLGRSRWSPYHEKKKKQINNKYTVHISYRASSDVNGVVLP